MALKNGSGYCKMCESQVMTQANKPNHILHILLSALTLGVWLIVWLILCISATGNYRCTKCGSQVGS